MATTLATYVYGNYIDDALQMERDRNGDGLIDAISETFYYNGDDMFNVMAVTDGNGDVVERYEYGDYGAPTITAGPASPLIGLPDPDEPGETVVDGYELSESAIDNPYMFTGRRFDNETGWYSFRALP